MIILLKEFKDLTNMKFNHWTVIEYAGRKNKDNRRYWLCECDCGNKTRKEISFRNLKKSGELIVAVPNIDSFEFGFFERDWFHLEPKLHLWHFSPKSIKILLRKCGFRIKRIDYFSIEHHSTGLLQSFINKGSSQKNSLHKLVKSIRQTDAVAVKASDVLVNLFWLTLGLPIIFIVWIINSLTERSGAFVIVAVKR